MSKEIEKFSQVRVIDETSSMKDKRGTVYEVTEFLGVQEYDVIFLSGRIGKFKEDQLKHIHNG